MSNFPNQLQWEQNSQKGENGQDLLQLDAHFKAPPTWLWEINTKQWVLPFFSIFHFTNIATLRNKDLDKKRLRISSSGTDMDSIEAAQDGEYIKMTLTEYQSVILRLTAIKDDTKIWEEIFSLEARLNEAQVEIQALKKTSEVNKTVNDTRGFQ